jgi:hypothetical protein
VADKLIPCNHKKRHFLTSFIFAALFSSAVTLFFWLTILQYISAPKFLSFINLADSYVLSNAKSINDPMTLHNIGELVRDGVIISVKDLWSFESTFYQTIITVLIFLNALLGTVAFFIIRSSSVEQAKEESRKSASEEVATHLKSLAFFTKIDEVINGKVQFIKNDLDFESNTIILSADRINILEEENHKSKQLIKDLVETSQQLKSQISIISEHISKHDMDDNEGLNLEIRPVGDK